MLKAKDKYQKHNWIIKIVPKCYYVKSKQKDRETKEKRIWTKPKNCTNAMFDDVKNKQGR